MLCDTCFLGHSASRYRWWESFDPITSSNLTFDGGQVNVRSRSGQIFKSMFLNKKHKFLAQNFLRIPNMAFVFFCTMRRTSENVIKWRHHFLAIYCKYLACGTFALFLVSVFWSRVSKKQLNTFVSSRRVEWYKTWHSFDVFDTQLNTSPLIKIQNFLATLLVMSLCTVWSVRDNHNPSTSLAEI